MYGEETAERQYSGKKITQREPEYDEDIGRYRRKSTQVKWGGRDHVMQDVSRTRVWDIPRTGIHSGGRLIEIVEQKADKWMIGYLR